MHNSDSQEELVEEFLKYQVKDSLMYKEFDYDTSEWDNIPTIIPRFVSFISKHMEALTNICRERFNHISTPDLEASLNSRIKGICFYFSKLKYEYRT